MATVTTSRKIRLDALPFGAAMTWSDTKATGTVAADVPEADLRTAVDSAPVDDAAAVEAQINDRLDQAITALSSHVGRAKPSTAAAQASAAYDATVLLCRVALGVIRLIRRRLDAAE